MELIKILLGLRHKNHLVMVRENIMVWLLKKNKKKMVLIAIVGNVPSCPSKQMVLLQTKTAVDDSTSHEEYPVLFATNSAGHGPTFLQKVTTNMARNCPKFIFIQDI